MKKIVVFVFAFFAFLPVSFGALDNFAPSDYWNNGVDGYGESIYWNNQNWANRRIAGGVETYSVFTDIYTYLLANSDAKLVSDFNYEYNTITGYYYPARTSTYIFASHPLSGYVPYGTSYLSPFNIASDKFYQDGIGYCMFYDYTNRTTSGTNLFIPWEDSDLCLDSFTYAGNTWHSYAVYFGTPSPEPPLSCNSEIDPSCFCSNTLVKSGTDFTYYPYTFTGADLVVTGFLGNSLEIRPPGYNFFTQPDLLAKFNFSNVGTDADLSGDFYPNSFFEGTGGTYDTTGLIDSFSESRLNFQTFYFGTGSSSYYYSTGIIVANSGTLAFDYVKIHGLNNDTVDLEYVSIEDDFNGKEYGEVKRIYDVRTGDYIRLPRPTRSIKIILKPNLYYYIPKIEVGYYVPDTSFLEECTYVSPEDIENINFLDGVGTSQALSDMIKEQMEQDSLEAFKFDNPILDGVYQKMVGLFVKIGLNNLVQLIKITVPQEPVEFINMPRLYISGALIGVEDSTLDIVVLENDYDVSGLLPESPYGPFFIGLICTVFWIVYLSIIVSVVFFGNSFLISFIDGIVTRFFGNSVLNSNGGNIFSLFTTASWLFFIGKALITILSFVNFIFPILTYGKNLLLGILTIITLNLGGYTTFATLSNWLLYTIATGVLVYAMMLAGKAYLKLN